MWTLGPALAALALLLLVVLALVFLLFLQLSLLSPPSPYTHRHAAIHSGRVTAPDALMSISRNTYEMLT